MKPVPWRPFVLLLLVLSPTLVLAILLADPQRNWIVRATAIKRDGRGREFDRLSGLPQIDGLTGSPRFAIGVERPNTDRTGGD